jgi:methylglutaconyl-CoA hydratase
LNIESNRIESNPIQSNPIKSNQIRSNQIESNPIKSNQIKSNQLPRAMATKFAVDGFFRTALVLWSPRNQKQVLTRQHLHFQRRGRIGLSNEKQLFSLSSSSPHHVLVETLYHPTNTENGNDDVDDGRTRITKITLNRPKVNAMGRHMISELQDCLVDLEKECCTSRCVVLTSSVEKVFSAGADLKERATMTEDETQTFVTLLRNTMERFASLPMPTIAAIDGVAVGGGLELALAADLRIASDAPNVLLGFPETSLAILPGAGGTQRLPRLIGAAKAKELIWTGTKLSGQQAFDCGLVNELVVTGLANNAEGEGVNGTVATSTTTAIDRALELAFSIASHGPVAIRASKAAIEQGGKLTCMKDALEIERECYAKVVPTKDRLEGLRAFREGRTPTYKGE